MPSVWRGVRAFARSRSRRLLLLTSRATPSHSLFYQRTLPSSGEAPTRSRALSRTLGLPAHRPGPMQPRRPNNISPLLPCSRRGQVRRGRNFAHPFVLLAIRTSCWRNSRGQRGKQINNEERPSTMHTIGCLFARHELDLRRAGLLALLFCDIRLPLAARRALSAGLDHGTHSRQLQRIIVQSGHRRLMPLLLKPSPDPAA